MNSLQRARRGAEAEMKEITDNLGVIRSFKSLFVARAPSLFPREGLDAGLRRELEKVLALGQTDLRPAYAGLYVQVHGVVERYINGLVAACVERIAAGKTSYSDLPPDFARSHSAHAGRALGYISDGSVNGVSFDFPALTAALAVCFADTSQPVLVSRVFTISMGNCTPERLKSLFGILGLSEPFADDIGSHSEIKALPSYRGGARALAKQAKKDWKDALSLRNRILHDASSVPVITDSDVVQLSALALALIAAFESKVDLRYP